MKKYDCGVESMVKKSCPSWLAWTTLVAGVLYLLSTWLPSVFSWWGTYFPVWGVFFTLVGLWGLAK